MIISSNESSVITVLNSCMVSPVKTAWIYSPLLLILFTLYSYGLDITPDSLTRGITWTDYHEALDTLIISNPGTSEVRVDSITVRLLDGDSTDFIACSECEPGNFGNYAYRGWVFGVTDTTFRYVKDSLFLLQDGSGLPVSFSVAADGTAKFALHLMVNCPICGRMPSIPKTVHYAFMFHSSSGVTDTVTLTIQDSTPVKRRVGHPCITGKSSVITSEGYTITGRKIGLNAKRYTGVVIGNGSKYVNTGDGLFENRSNRN